VIYTNVPAVCQWFFVNVGAAWRKLRPQLWYMECRLCCHWDDDYKATMGSTLCVQPSCTHLQGICLLPFSHILQKVMCPADVMYWTFTCHVQHVLLTCYVKAYIIICLYFVINVAYLCQHVQENVVFLILYSSTWCESCLMYVCHVLVCLNCLRLSLELQYINWSIYKVQIWLHSSANDPI